jgi:hypothetical protein
MIYNKYIIYIDIHPAKLTHVPAAVPGQRSSALQIPSPSASSAGLQAQAPFRHSWSGLAEQLALKVYHTGKPFTIGFAQKYSASMLPLQESV